MHRLLAFVLFATLGATACTGDDAPVAPTPSPALEKTSISPPVAATPSPEFTPLSPPVVVATPRVAVTGLFVEPRDPPATVVRPLGEPPPSTFTAWDRSTTLLYDVVAGTEMNLGPGQVGWFSPDGTRLLWISGTDDSTGTAMLLDITTGERESLGSARLALWGDDETISLTVGNTDEIVNLRTGERKQGSEIRSKHYLFDVITTPDGSTWPGFIG